MKKVLQKKGLEAELERLLTRLKELDPIKDQREYNDILNRAMEIYDLTRSHRQGVEWAKVGVSIIGIGVSVAETLFVLGYGTAWEEEGKTITSDFFRSALKELTHRFRP